MSDATRGTVTRLLSEVRDGNEQALDELVPLVYKELRALANRHRRRWQGDFTLNTTAIVHEAYLKLVDQTSLAAASRSHFLAIASRAMRHILCNHARDRRRLKRGGDLARVPLDEVMERLGDPSFADDEAAVLADLDDALRTLEGLDPRQGRIVECRFFGGLTIEDTAAAVGISPATVKREWAVARAWLYREMHTLIDA